MLVFVSYASEDREKVNEICVYLKRLNIDYWLDENRLRGAENWQRRVLEVLPRVDVVLFCVTEASQHSVNVKWELEQARLHNRKILPVKLSPCDMTTPDLEEIVYIELFNPATLFHSLNQLADSLLNFDQDIRNIRPPRIFINYRQGADLKDQKLAEYLNRELSNHGADVWSDINEVGPGDSWGRAIKRGIDTSDWMLLIVSPTSMHSRRVDAIWREFINQGKEANLILVVNTMTPVNFKLRRCPYADFTTAAADDWHEGWQQLVTILHNREVRFIPAIQVDDEIAEPTIPLPWDKDYGTLYLTNPQAIQPRYKFSKPDAMIQRAQHEIWISGISMTKVAQSNLHRFLTSSEDPGRTMHFLVLDPADPACLNDASGYLGADKDKLRRRIEFSLDFLSELQTQSVSPDQVQIKVMKYRPSSGYFIIDPQHSDTGAMTISPYFYNIDNVRTYHTGQTKEDLEPPFIYLSRLGERQPFEVFWEDFKRSWEKARVWPDGVYT
jgi:TIR domain